MDEFLKSQFQSLTFSNHCIDTKMRERTNSKNRKLLKQLRLGDSYSYILAGHEQPNYEKSTKLNFTMNHNGQQKLNSSRKQQTDKLKSFRILGIQIALIDSINARIEYRFIIIIGNMSIENNKILRQIAVLEIAECNWP